MDKADEALKNKVQNLNERFKKHIEKEKEMIKLPGANRNNRAFSLDIAESFRKKQDIFYKEIEDSLIEISEYIDDYSKKTITAFRTITNARLMNLIEKNVDCYITVQDRYDGWRDVIKTPSETLMKYLMENDEFKKALYVVNRLLMARMPFLIDNELVIPNKGYNQKIQAYVTNDTEDIVDMDLEKAKLIIKHILSEFCFKEEQDRIMAIAALLTPGCRGLYKTITSRTPIFLYIANRERAGKDYLAGITGIIYEGNAISNPPISSADKGNQNNSEELRKKITSALKQGTRRLHFENNKGKINNAVLEQVTTSETWQDRELGKNESITLPNEIDFSLSANIGLSWTPDFWNRCRPINLFLAQENPNERIFKKPNLHQYVKENRSIIQSAIITLIKEWYKAGMPPGETFTSFPEWARVVGGIMKFAELGDPCVTLSDDFVIGGDIETSNFKDLFNIMYNHQEKSGKKEHKISEIVSIIQSFQISEDSLFSGWNFEERSAKVNFGIVFRKYINREFNKITLKISKKADRTNRDTYIFVKMGENGSNMPTSFDDDKLEKSGMMGIPRPQLKHLRINYIEECPSITKNTNIPHFGEIHDFLETFNKGKPVCEKDILTLFNSQEDMIKQLNIGRTQGRFAEPKPGKWISMR